MVNGKAVESAIRIGLALNCEIAEWCRFARKNYFYPDMPKNFQTSQYDEPIAFDGWIDVEVDGETYRIEIERAHMEEDTGKSSHMGGATGRIHGADYSLLDYNRAGIPLIEIVTRTIEVPGDKAPLVARAYVQQLRDLVLALGVSDARMDQGSLRCDVNLSLKPTGSSTPRHPQRDQERQLVPLGRARGPLRDLAVTPASSTRAGRSCRRPGTSTRTPAPRRRVARSPTPRTTATSPSPTSRRSRRRGSGSRSCGPRCPSRPVERRRRLQAEWGFSDLEMRDTVGAGALDLVAATIEAGRRPAGRPQVVALRAGPPRQRGRASSWPRWPITPGQVARIQALVDDGVAQRQARPPGVRRRARRRGHARRGRRRPAGSAVVSDDGALPTAVDRAIEANPDVADKIRDGKVAAAGALIGAVMKEMRGQADAARVRELILSRLT